MNGNHITVEFVYNGFAYNVNLPTTSHFAWSPQNSYLLCTFRFAYNGIAYNVNSNITAPFFYPPDLFCSLTAALEPFISCRNGRMQLTLSLPHPYYIFLNFCWKLCLRARQCYKMARKILRINSLAHHMCAITIGSCSVSLITKSRKQNSKQTKAFSSLEKI